GTFSFYPSKNIGALGDGGMVVTDDDALAKQVRMMRNYGQSEKYHHVTKGFNRRLDTLQAAFLSVKLAGLDSANESRAKRAAQYSEALAGTHVTPPPPDDESIRSVWHLYVIRTSTRDELQSFLQGRGISTGIHYPIPIHFQPPFRTLAGDFPVAERLADEVLSLPMYADLSSESVNRVADAIREFDAGLLADIQAGDTAARTEA
ncbi:MAG: DegT/DnrJ/EryC1/StrS family aminotransferase, partial [Vicinamibacterales bacterium]